MSADIKMSNIVSNAHIQLTQVYFIFYLYYLASPQWPGTPQQREPITVGPYHLTHPVYFPCGRKAERPEETHDFWQSIDFTLCT